MLEEAANTIRVTRRFAAGAERVFDAWLDARTAGRWLFATPTGHMARVEIEPRVGGRYLVVERRDGVDVAHTGTYLELARPARLAFTFSVDPEREGDRVTVDIAPLPRGCELVLVQVMRPEDAAFADRTEAGWSAIVAGLGAWLDEEEVAE